MSFKIEVLRAGSGDCLLLHYETEDGPGLVVVDGGDPEVWGSQLRPALEKIRTERNLPREQPLPLRLVAVTHIDTDHIGGIESMFTDLMDLHADRRPLPVQIRTLWHNSFDDIIGPEPALFQHAAETAGNAGAGGIFPAGTRDLFPGVVLLADIARGRSVRDKGPVLCQEVNQPGADGLVSAGGSRRPCRLKDGPLTLRVIGPDRKQLKKLQRSWDRELKKKDLAVNPAEVLRQLDQSAFNLSSIVILASVGTRRVLICGDARGDYILDALGKEGLLTDGCFHADVIKLPHHGSAGNMPPPFLERVTAGHYIFCANGRHGNPDLETFTMLAEARAGHPYTVHLTYDPAEFHREHSRREQVAAQLELLRRLNPDSVAVADPAGSLIIEFPEED